MFKKTTQLVVVFVGLVLSTFAFSAEKKLDCKSESTYPNVTKSELQQLTRDKKAFVIDVNSEESFKKSHVDSAIHYGSHEKDFLSVLPKDKSTLIVAYCGGPMCTAWKKAAERACEAGYTNVRHFKDGIKGWMSTSELKSVTELVAKQDQTFISAVEARGLIKDKGAILLDVRGQDEYKEKHIPGALLFPVESLEANLFRLGDFDRPIVVYCRSGKRAGIAKAMLEKSGFKQVYNLGSVDSWK